MNYVQITESDIERFVLQATGNPYMTVDLGPSGETVHVFGQDIKAHLGISIWDILPAVGLTESYFQEYAEDCIRKAILACKADIEREIATRSADLRALAES